MTDVAEYFPLAWTPYWNKIDRNCGDDPSFCSRDATSRRDPTLYRIVLDLLRNPNDSLNLNANDRCNEALIRRDSTCDYQGKSQSFPTCLHNRVRHNAHKYKSCNAR